MTGNLHFSAITANSFLGSVLRLSLLLKAQVWNQLSKIILIVRLKPFDTSTQEGRSQERYRRAALTMLSSLAARSVSILTVLISVPLTLGYLGVERYGLWMTISSVIAMLVFADRIQRHVFKSVDEQYGRNHLLAHTEDDD